VTNVLQVESSQHTDRRLNSLTKLKNMGRSRHSLTCNTLFPKSF